MIKEVIYENILTSIAGGLMTISIHRPDKLNALNRRTIEELGTAIQAAQKNAAVEGIILTGSGDKAFVAGADISEFSSLTVEEGKMMSAHGQRVFKSIEVCPKPVVAAVNGFALGGGCELAMSCHLRVASENAKFGQPEVKLGLIPGYGGTQRLIQLIGKTKAMEYLMTADMISAPEALQFGLVNYVTTSEQLIPKCEELLNKIRRQSPKAIEGIVNSVDAYFNPGTDGFAYEVDAFGKCFGTTDYKEGVSAFLEKRKAEFKR